MITFMMMYVTNVLCPCIHFIHSFKKMGSSDKLRDIRPMTSLHKLFRIWATQTAYYRPQEAIQCVQNKIKWMIFSIIFYRPLMTGLLSILHCTYLIHIFRYYFYCSFQENIRCMPGYYEKKSETLYNDNVEIKYFWTNTKD